MSEKVEQEEVAVIAWGQRELVAPLAWGSDRQGSLSGGGD